MVIVSKRCCISEMIPKAGQCPDEVTVTGADVNTVQNFDQNVSRLHTALRKHISFNVTEMVKKKKDLFSIQIMNVGHFLSKLLLYCSRSFSRSLTDCNPLFKKCFIEFERVGASRPGGGRKSK